MNLKSKTCTYSTHLERIHFYWIVRKQAFVFRLISKMTIKACIIFYELITKLYSILQPKSKHRKSCTVSCKCGLFVRCIVSIYFQASVVKYFHYSACNALQYKLQLIVGVFLFLFSRDLAVSFVFNQLAHQSDQEKNTSAWDYLNYSTVRGHFFTWSITVYKNQY